MRKPLAIAAVLTLTAACGTATAGPAETGTLRTVFNACSR